MTPIRPTRMIFLIKRSESMKKPLAILLLIVGGLAGVFGLSFANVIIFFLLYGAGLAVDIALTLAAAFGIDRLRVLFKRKYEMKAPKFLVLAYVPSVLCSAAAVIIFMELDRAGYFEGLFAGLGEFIFSLSYVITAGAILIMAFIWLIISTIITKHRKVNSNEPKN